MCVYVHAYTAAFLKFVVIPRFFTFLSYLKREEDRALEKNRELEERIVKMKKEELEEQHLK